FITHSSPLPLFFFLTTPPPLPSTLFPYTTLFRSIPSIVYWPFLTTDDIRGGLSVRRSMLYVVRSSRTGSEGFLRQLRESVWAVRSEEHTSELQSRFDLVCRLLLEKNKENMKPGAQ